jgi:F-type H+-transporting ATPase subunit b
MEKIIEAFGVGDYEVLLAQFVSFGILLFVLYKFAYGPIIKMLDERTAKIEKGIKDAEEIQKKLNETEEREREILTEAKKQAQEIILNAEKMAEKNKVEILENSKVMAQEIIKNAEKTIEAEKSKLKSELKKEIADLVLASTEKVLREKIDEEKDKEIIAGILKG